MQGKVHECCGFSEYGQLLAEKFSKVMSIKKKTWKAFPTVIKCRVACLNDFTRSDVSVPSVFFLLDPSLIADIRIHATRAICYI